MFSCIFDLFYPLSSKPTFDLFLTYFNIFGVSGPLGRLLLHKVDEHRMARNEVFFSAAHRAPPLHVLIVGHK